MNASVPKLTLCLLGCAVLSGCGTPGVPLPPSLELPRPVTNLRASRKGDKVTLTWSAPTKTTDQHNLRRGGTTAICRDFTLMEKCAQIGKVPFQRPSANKTQNASLETYSDQIPQTLELQNPLANLAYAISVQNPYGRSAGLSNQVQVPAAPTLPAPSGVQAQLTSHGVRLTWSALPNSPEIPGLRFNYRIYRRDIAAKKDVVASELPVTDQPSPEVLDQSFEWEKSYEYRLVVVTIIRESNGSEEQLEGEDSQSISIVTHDVFPPATPTGLQAVFSGPGQKPFIDLVWSPNNETDLAGYFVYRAEAGSSPEKLNQQPVKSPAYRDDQVSSGHAYTYSVSAVDIRGNESAHSEDTSESVPATQ